MEQQEDSQNVDNDDDDLGEENPAYDPLKDDTNLSAIQSLNSHHSDKEMEDVKTKNSHVNENVEGDLIKPKKGKKTDVKKLSGISNKDMDDD